jgi:hypothetical protein
MSSTTAATRPRLSPARAIVSGGMLAGVLDITAACTYWYFKANLPPARILRGVASGLLGPSARQGGMGIALLGLLCHFTIAFGAATVYYLASRKIPFLVDHYLIAGPLYGICVYFFMNYVVLPLSRFPIGPTFNPMSAASLSWGIPVHMFCVGMAIAVGVAVLGRE